MTSHIERVTGDEDITNKFADYFEATVRDVNGVVLRPTMYRMIQMVHGVQYDCRIRMLCWQLLDPPLTP